MRRNGATWIVLSAVLVGLVLCGIASPALVQVLEFVVKVLGYMFLGPIQ